MIFGKRGFVYRLVLNHFAHTFSLSYFFRLIATLLGAYSRSRRQAQERSTSTGGHVLRRIYGHIVAQGLGAEKLTALWEIPGLPRRNLNTAAQFGMASVIVLMAWISWPGKAAAPAMSAAPVQSIPVQVSAASIAPAQNTDRSVNDSIASSPAPAVETSPDRIEATKERFSALTAQQTTSDDSATSAKPQLVPYGAEIDEGAVSSAGLQKDGTDASTAQAESSISRQPGSMSKFLAALAKVTSGPREAVDQAIAGVSDLASDALGKSQPTAIPAPTVVPTPQPVTALVPGSQWVQFTPGVPAEIDHFWLGQPHPTGYDQFYSPNYQFGSTAGDRYRIHHGVDISNEAGTPVLAMGEGEVVHAGPDNPALLGPYNNFYGNSVVIRLNRRLPTPEGEQDVYVLLGHMSEVYVERGQQVKPEDLVGAVGMTGIAIGPHLHVEVRVGQNSYLHSVNPALWMQNPPGTGAVAARLLTADGRSWSLARLSLLRYENGGSRWVRTLEIYPDAEDISGDPVWGENGALSNLAAGAYWIGGVVNGEKFGQNITINSGETTFVELRTQQ